MPTQAHIARRTRSSLWLFAAVGLAVIVGLSTAPGRIALAAKPELADAWNAPAVAWQDIGSGIRESTRSGKPVIMLFHATWCTSCKRYRQVWRDPGVVAGSKNFVMILIDVDKDPEANGAFSPDGTYVPRTIFLDNQGDIMQDIRGKDPEYPHTIDLDDPSELRGLMAKAAGRPAAPPPASAPGAPDERAEN